MKTSTALPIFLLKFKNCLKRKNLTCQLEFVFPHICWIVFPMSMSPKFTLCLEHSDNEYHK